MGRKIIFISGNMNSGKSTVSRLLKEEIERPAVIEIDELRNFIDWMDVRDTVEINWGNAVSVIKNFIKSDFNVIVPYPLSERSYNYVIKELKGIKADKHFIILDPELKTLLKRRGSRRLPREDKMIIKQLHQNKITKQDFGVKIDNSKQTPKETVKEILDIISK